MSPDTDTAFRMVKDSGAFDFIERTPPTGQLEAFQRASRETGIPLLAGGFFYTLGRDEPLLEWHLRIARDCGTRIQNVQVLRNDATGTRVTNQRVADFYCWAAELGEKHGVTPCLEIHVNMWSERFTRVAEVAALVEARGIPFNLTLDHSHVIFQDRQTPRNKPSKAPRKTSPPAVSFSNQTAPATSAISGSATTGSATPTPAPPPPTTPSTPAPNTPMAASAAASNTPSSPPTKANTTPPGKNRSSPPGKKSSATSSPTTPPTPPAVSNW